MLIESCSCESNKEELDEVGFMPPGAAKDYTASKTAEELAHVSDEALDNAYHYGRSNPGNSFGWQANVKSAEFAKKAIEAGETDIEKISDAIHKGWNVTAKAFVSNPDQFDDTEKLRAAGKLEAKLAQREKLMNIEYAQLPEDEKEKDRVVARALFKAIKGKELDEMFFFPDTRSREEKNRDANKPQDILGRRPEQAIAKHGKEYKAMKKGTSAQDAADRERYGLGGPEGPLPESFEAFVESIREMVDGQLDELSPDVYHRAAAGRSAQADMLYKLGKGAAADKAADSSSNLRGTSRRREKDLAVNKQLAGMSPATMRKMGLKKQFTKADGQVVEDEQLDELGDTFMGRMKLRALAKRADKTDPRQDVAKRFNDSDVIGAFNAQYRDSEERLSNVANAARERIANKGTDTAAIQQRNAQADADQAHSDTSHMQWGRDRLNIDDPDYVKARFAKVAPIRPGQYGVSQRNTFRGKVPEPVKENELTQEDAEFQSFMETLNYMMRKK